VIGRARSVLCGLVLATVAAAQADPGRFDELLAAVRAASSMPQRAALAGPALDLFLRLDASSRASRLAAGAWIAQLAGDHRMALQLAMAARQSRSPVVEGLVWTHLQALLAGGRVEECVEQAQRDDQAGSWTEVAAVFAEHQRALLPAAARLLQTGDTGQGLWLFQALSRLRPEDGIAMANLALACRHLGLTGTAAQTYRQALRLAPADEQVWNDYGLFLRGSGRLVEALDAFERSYGLDDRPGVGPAITNLVQMELLQPRCVQPDPLPRASAALQLRPEATLLRRLALDLVLARAGAGQSPDKGDKKR